MLPGRNICSRRKRSNWSVALTCHSPILKAAKIKRRRERNEGLPVLSNIGEESADIDCNAPCLSLASNLESDMATKSVDQPKIDEDTRPKRPYGKEFTCRATGSKTSIEGSGSASGVTVSSYSSLLMCSDVDSFAHGTSSNSTLGTYLSPEIFRGSESLGGSRQLKQMAASRINSTLLDVSTAKDLHMLPSPVNMSSIGDWSLENRKKQDTLSQPVFKEPGNSLVPKSAAVSIAGTTLHKIVHVQEITPQQEQSVDLSRNKVPGRKKVAGKTSSVVKCRKKVNFDDPLETELQPQSTLARVSCAANVLNSTVNRASVSHCSAASIGVRRHDDIVSMTRFGRRQSRKQRSYIAVVGEEQSSSEVNSVKNCPSAVSDLNLNVHKNWSVKTSTPIRRLEHLTPDVSPVCTPTIEEELIPNTTGVFVNSEEIIPASVTLEENENTVPHQQVKKICSIIAAPNISEPSVVRGFTVDTTFHNCIPKVLDVICDENASWIQTPWGRSYFASSSRQ